MKVWHCITLCLAFSLVLTETIGTSPVDTSGNGLADSSVSVNSEMSKSIEDLNVDELGAMIDQMLARLKNTQNNYPNTTAEVPSQIINPPTSTPNSSSPTQQPQENIPKAEKPPSPNDNPPLTPVDNTQTPQSGFFDFSPISQPGSVMLENTQQNTVASSSKNQAQQEKKSNNPLSNGSASQNKSTPNSQSTTSQNSHQIKADSIPSSPQTNVEEGRNNDAQSKKQPSQVVNDLLSGDYFTYFVDLNADKTGSVFLNDPDKKQATQGDKKNSSINFQQQVTQQAYNQLNGPQQKQQQNIHNTTSQVKNTRQNNKITSEKAQKTSQSTSSNLQQEPEEKNPSLERKNASSQQKERSNIVEEPALKLPNRNINSVSLCYTDDDCKYDYIMFVGMGLEVKCKSGACIPVY